MPGDACLFLADAGQGRAASTAVPAVPAASAPAVPVPEHGAVPDGAQTEGPVGSPSSESGARGARA
eukprot:9169608-Alexandrium_andersonii.AAC.1